MCFINTRTVIVMFLLFAKVCFCSKSAAISMNFEKRNQSFTADNVRERLQATSSDEFITNNQKKCFTTRSIVSCIKYKVGKVIWKLATNKLGFFPNENSRSSHSDNKLIRFVQLGEPTEMEMFVSSRSLQDDSELSKMIKFFKRAIETFGKNHGFEISFGADSGARINVDDIGEPRGRHDKKKKKWLIILPLIILMKLAHLKMTVVPMLLGIVGLNVLLVGGMGWLIHYLKYKTLCKIHPQLVQTHSHAYDSDPSDYSTFAGSSFPGGGSFHSGGAHDVYTGSVSKDWGTSKAYNGYNYLDTISKRLQ